MRHALFLISIFCTLNTFSQVTVADVRVSVSAMLNPTNDTLTFTATAFLPANPYQCGDDDARDTRLILSLPPESEIVSPRASGCSVLKHSSTGDPSFVACYLGNMHAGATGKTIDIVVKTDYKGLANVGPYGCSAFIVSETPDCNRNNNFDVIEIAAPTPRVSAGKLLSIYPNPTADLLNIEVDAKSASYQVDILSTSGQLVSRKEFPSLKNGLQKLTLSTNELEEGVYFVSIYEGSRLIKTEKISVSK